MRHFDYKINKSYWTYDFYEQAIKHISTKIPIVIPSYNRYENNYFLDYVRENMSAEEPWPIYVVVRKSQKKLYEANYGDIPEITFVAFKDEEIDNIGKTRNRFIKYFTSKFDSIFVLDDDLKLEFKTMSSRVEDGKRYYRFTVDKKKNNVAKIMAMWQLSHEFIMQQYDGCWSTYLYMRAFAFDPKYGDRQSYNAGGKAICAVCLDLKKLKKYKLNYLSSTETGHEDIDIIIRAMQYKLYPVAIKCISFTAPMNNNSVVNTNLGFNDIRERINMQNKKLYDMYHSTNPYIGMNKRDNLIINWNQYFKDINLTHLNGSIKKELYNNLKKGN